MEVQIRDVVRKPDFGSRNEIRFCIFGKRNSNFSFKIILPIENCITMRINPEKIHSFIHSGHFYSAPSSPLPLRGAPDYSTDTVSEFHAEADRQLQIKDLPKVPT